MTINKFRPHLLVLPEDDANRQIANGFALEVRHGRRIQVLTEAGGWSHVCDDFRKNQQAAMKTLSERRVVLLLDFDDVADRRSTIESQIPAEFRERVFLLGCRTEPEALLGAGLGSFENIGRRLAAECRDGARNLWRHELLRNNLDELNRLVLSVRPFLFDPD